MDADKGQLSRKFSSWEGSVYRIQLSLLGPFKQLLFSKRKDFILHFPRIEWPCERCLTIILQGIPTLTMFLSYCIGLLNWLLFRTFSYFKEGGSWWTAQSYHRFMLTESISIGCILVAQKQSCTRNGRCKWLQVLCTNQQLDQSRQSGDRDSSWEDQDEEWRWQGRGGT